MIMKPRLYALVNPHQPMEPQFNPNPCSNCKKPLGMIRVLKDWGIDSPWPTRYEVLFQCMGKRCSWGLGANRPSKIHLSMNTIDYRPPNPLPNDDSPLVVTVKAPMKPNLLTTATEVVVMYDTKPNLMEMKL